MMIISDDNHTTYICDLTEDDQWGIMPNEGRNIICTARCITVNGWGSRCFFFSRTKKSLRIRHGDSTVILLTNKDFLVGSAFRPLGKIQFQGAQSKVRSFMSTPAS
jgi:hypothetical protein